MFRILHIASFSHNVASHGSAPCAEADVGRSGMQLCGCDVAEPTQHSVDRRADLSPRVAMWSIVRAWRSCPVLRCITCANPPPVPSSIAPHPPTVPAFNLPTPFLLSPADQMQHADHSFSQREKPKDWAGGDHAHTHFLEFALSPAVLQASSHPPKCHVVICLLLASIGLHVTE